MDIEMEYLVPGLREYIPGFPTYTVDILGRVRNENGRIIARQVNQQGVHYVSLRDDNGDWTSKSVSRLVAEAFIPQSNPSFDTPINLDGDRANNDKENLVWRPRWFAIKYARQFKTTWEGTPVQHVENGRIFLSPLEAAIRYGLLALDVYTQASNYMLGHEDITVWPGEHRFRLVL
jgi:hypothetical protein